MKIEITKKPRKEFYDEFLFVAGNYKKIKKNPNTKARLLTNDAKKLYLISMLFFILFIPAYIKYKDTIYLFIIIIFFLLSIFSIGYYSAIKKRIQLYISTEANQVLSITDKGLELKQKNQKVHINWTSIEYIVINKYSICAIPKNPTEIMLSLSNDYKDMFLKAIKKYKKENLIIDNYKD